MENLTEEFGNAVVFDPINVRQRMAGSEDRLEITVTYDEAQGIFDEAMGAAAMASAVEQLRELDIDNRIEHSFITKDEFPGLLAGQREGPDHQRATKD